MSERRFVIHVNRIPVNVEPDDADMTLLEFLNERLDLTGTKFCCGIGVCRACTVGVRTVVNPQTGALSLLEKTLACSTQVAAVSGTYIETVEGLAGVESLSALQTSFLHHFAFQCGYCTPGFLMAATAMLEHLPPGPLNDKEIDALIDTWVGDHLCRCTGYVQYREAIAEVVRQKLKRGGRL